MTFKDPLCFSPPRSILQQQHEGGGEDAEARHHVSRGFPGGSQPDEDAPARAARSPVRRGHQIRAYLHYH